MVKVYEVDLNAMDGLESLVMKVIWKSVIRYKKENLLKLSLEMDTLSNKSQLKIFTVQNLV